MASNAYPMSLLLQQLFSMGLGKSITFRVKQIQTKDALGSDTGTEDTAVSNTTLTGYIQDDTTAGTDILPRGYTKTGDALCYLAYNTSIDPKDQIVDGSTVWEIEEVAHLGTHYTVLTLRRFS